MVMPPKKLRGGGGGGGGVHTGLGLSVRYTCIRSGLVIPRILKFYIKYQHEKLVDPYFFVFPSVFRSRAIPVFRQAFDGKWWVACVHNSSYSFVQINLKLCSLFCSGL